MKNPEEWWNDAQFKTFAKALKRQWGDFWSYSSEPVRNALVEAKAAEIAMGQDEGTTMNSEVISSLCRGIGRAAGLEFYNNDETA